MQEASSDVDRLDRRDRRRAGRAHRRRRSDPVDLLPRPRPESDRGLQCPSAL